MSFAVYLRGGGITSDPSVPDTGGMKTVSGPAWSLDGDVVFIAPSCDEELIYVL